MLLYVQQMHMNTLKIKQKLCKSPQAFFLYVRNIFFSYLLPLPSYDIYFLEISLIKAFNGIRLKYLHNILKWLQINLLLDLNYSHSEIQLNRHHFAGCIKCNQQGEWKIIFPLTKHAYCIGTSNAFSSLAKNVLTPFQLLKTADKTVPLSSVFLVVVFFLWIHHPNTHIMH